MKKYFENDEETTIPVEFEEVVRSLRNDNEKEQFIDLCEKMEQDGKSMYGILEGMKDLPTRLNYVRDALASMTMSRSKL